MTPAQWLEEAAYIETQAERVALRIAGALRNFNGERECFLAYCDMQAAGAAR